MSNWESVTVKIINWDKFNPKRDQSTYTWLRLSNNIATDPDLYGLSAAQKFVWIALLCDASKKNKDEICVSYNYYSHITGVSLSDVVDMFKFLESKQIVRLRDNARPPDVAGTTPTYVRTNVRTNERTNEPARATAEQTPVVIAPLRTVPQIEGLDKCEEDWLGTLAHFKIPRTTGLTYQEKVSISLGIKEYGLSQVRYALVGMRFEPKTEKFDPANHVTIFRVFDVKNFDKFTNLAAKKRAENQAKEKK